MSVKLTYGATEVVLRNPELGNRYECEIHQARGRTADGLLLVSDKSIRVERLHLVWRELEDADKAAVDDFFGAAKVDGSVNAFTYTDHDGAGQTVRLLSDRLDWNEYWDGRWGLSLVLELVEES